MIDRNIILSKISAVRRHLKRIEAKCNVDLEAFRKDLDRQESVLFNLQMAIQNCIDIAAHIISEKGVGVPGSTNEMFYLLEENGFIKLETTEKLVKAVGFRNLVVHEYVRIELEQVFQIARNDIRDLNEFLASVLEKLRVFSE